MVLVLGNNYHTIQWWMYWHNVKTNTCCLTKCKLGTDSVFVLFNATLLRNMFYYVWCRNQFWKSIFWVLGNFLGVCGMHHIFWHLFGHVDPYTTGPFHPFLHLIQFLLLCTQCCVVWVGAKRQFMTIGKCLGLIIFLLFTHNIPFFYIILNFFETPSEMMNLVTNMPNKSNRPLFLKILTNFREIAMLGEMNEMGLISFWRIQKKMIFWSIANCANFPCH